MQLHGFNAYLCRVYHRVSGLRRAFDVFYLSRSSVFPATTVAQGARFLEKPRRRMSEAETQQAISRLIRDSDKASKEKAMTTLVIEHLKASELPSQWVAQLKADPGQTVTVRIETEPAGAEAAETFATDDPAFGIWRDRDETADVEAYLRLLRAPRYRSDGSRNEG